MRHRRYPTSSRKKKVKVQQSLDSRDEKEVSISVLPNERRKILKKVRKLSEQKMPRKLRELLEDAKAIETMGVRKKSRKKQNKMEEDDRLRVVTKIEGDDEGAERGVKSLPQVLEQHEYESSDQFIRRLENMSSRALAEVKVETKFDLDFCPRIQPKILSTKTGQEAEKTMKGRKKTTAEERLEKKRQKRRERDAKRKSKKKRKKGSKDDGDDNDFHRFQDHVSFGDIVMAPPAFSKQRRKL